MKIRAILLALLATLLAACASGAAASPAQPTGSPAQSTGSPAGAASRAPGSSSNSPSASPGVVCDGAQLQPPPTLACGAAIAAAAAALPPGHAPIVRLEFRRGGLCPPGAPCVPPMPDAGIVIVDLATGPPVFVYVSADAAGSVTASAPAPYPSGY